MIKEVSVRVKRLVAGPIGGLGKFENVTFEVEATADVEKDDNPHEVYDNLLAFCKDKINFELDKLEGKIVKEKLSSDYVPKGFNSDGTERDFLPQG